MIPINIAHIRKDGTEQTVDEHRSLGKVDYAYDERYRVKSISYDNEGSPRYSYTYAANGKLGSIRDYDNNVWTYLFYDLANRPMRTEEKYSGLTRTFQYTYDTDNCLTEFLENLITASSNYQYKTALTYDKDNRIKTVNYDKTTNNENIRYTYDALGRLYTRTLETGASDYTSTYVYYGSNTYGIGYTTNQINTITYKLGTATQLTLTYTYNDSGYIESVSDGTKSVRYTYDGLGQLTRVDDQNDTYSGQLPNGTTYVYTYDNGGNMTTKSIYAYTLNPPVTLLHHYDYTPDPTWKDKLYSVAYDDGTQVVVTSDDIGNITEYAGWQYTWEAGRQLKQMHNTVTNVTLQYKYNDAGLRTQKINGSTTTKYYWAGDKLSHYNDGANALHFYYDAAGKPAMVYYGGYTMVYYGGYDYYYKLNQQGDIIGIINDAGTQVVSYTYDAWGKQLSCTGTMASTLGAVNPLRYRGYISDNETGLYYLQSRYYNPILGRFMNADSFKSETGPIFHYNLMCYCSNNPVNQADPSGKDGLLDLLRSLFFGIFQAGNNETDGSLDAIAPQWRDDYTPMQQIGGELIGNEISKMYNTKYAVDISVTLTGQPIEPIYGKAGATYVFSPNKKFNAFYEHIGGGIGQGVGLPICPSISFGCITPFNKPGDYEGLFANVGICDVLGYEYDTTPDFNVQQNSITVTPSIGVYTGGDYYWQID